MQQSTPFEATQEAQEYLQQLQQEKVSLSEDASPLEQEAFKQLHLLQKRVSEVSAFRDAQSKQAAQIQTKIHGASRDLDTLSGQLSAYAQLLLSAEGGRRAVATKGPIPPPEPPTEEVLP